MEDLREPLLADIIKRITMSSDLNSLCLVSKRLCAAEAAHRGAIRVGCGVDPTVEALTSLFSRFSYSWKVEISYSGWTPNHGDQVNNQAILPSRRAVAGPS
ncbi:hypothetical protein D1007_43830 [Hordeum vulgare]|nr:hypothetical protein D1007_43830 [Hordeum vulgare]